MSIVSRLVAGFLLLCLLACTSVAPPTTVRLELSPTAEFDERFELRLVPNEDGATCWARWDLKDESRQACQVLSRQELGAVVEALDAAGTWQLTDGDTGDPEASVLYTRLLVESGTLRRATVWRGLSPSQGQVATALLSSPLGPLLGEGLSSVQRRKAEVSSY